MKNSHSYGQLVIGSLITTMHPLMCHVSCKVFWQNIKSPRWQPLYSSDLAAGDLWFFPKLKLPLKGKRFQTIDEFRKILWSSWWQFNKGFCRVFWTVKEILGELCGVPKLPTLKRTEAPLSYVQIFLYLVSSSINVSYYMAGYFLEFLIIIGLPIMTELNLICL